MLDWKWKILVKGTFVRGRHGPVIDACQAIIESGVRDDSSPHSLRAVGPPAVTQPDGSFQSWYLTKGSEGEITCPRTIEVFVRIAPGVWKPYVVEVDESRSSRLSECELLVDLGAVEIDPGEMLYVPDPDGSTRA